LAIIGDSLGRQYYLDLTSELYEYETGKFPINYDNLSFETKFLSFASYKRYYYSYNVTLLRCDNARFDQWTEECTKDVIRHSDYIILTVGAWYKPLFPPN
jgi:hypothetical protein